MTEHRGLRADGHLRVLEVLECAGHISQRELAEEVGLAVSHVNRIIRGLVSDGHLRVAEDRVRPYAYALTDRGQERLRRLSHDRYAAVVKDFLRVQARVRERLARLRREGVRRVALYGAGDILDVARPLARAAGLEVAIVVDDDPARQGTRRGRLVVQGPEALAAADPDAVVITSFRHADRIRRQIEADNGVRVVEL